MSKVIVLETVPSEARLLDILQSAHARHLHLITNGRETRICSFVPEGWKLHCATYKQPQQAAA